MRYVFLFLCLLEILLIAGFFIAPNWWLKGCFFILTLTAAVAIVIVDGERNYRAVNNLE